MSENRRSTRSSGLRREVRSQGRIEDSLRPSKRGQARGRGRAKAPPTPRRKEHASDEDTDFNPHLQALQLQEGAEIQVLNLVEEPKVKVSKPKVKVQAESSREVEAVGGQGVQDLLTKEEKILRDFDLNPLYGACLGISRMERYERAIRYHINPPPPTNVMQILNAHQGSKEFNTCIWDQNKLLHIESPPLRRRN